MSPRSVKSLSSLTMRSGVSVAVLAAILAGCSTMGEPTPVSFASPAWSISWAGTNLSSLWNSR